MKVKKVYVFALVTEDCPVGSFEEGDIIFVNRYYGDDISGDSMFEEKWEETYVDEGCYKIISDEEAKEMGANVEFMRRMRPYPKEIREGYQVMDPQSDPVNPSLSPSGNREKVRHFHIVHAETGKILGEINQPPVYPLSQDEIEKEVNRSLRGLKVKLVPFEKTTKD